MEHLTPEQRAQVEARLRGRATPAKSQIPRRDPDQRIPLSFAQDWMWNWDRIPIASPLHNAPSALRVRGRFDAARLADTLHRIVMRHEALRFVFESGGPDGPVQRPLEGAKIPIQIHEISGATEEERIAKTQEWAAEEARTSFDLSRGPLLRAIILRFADDDHAVLLTLHHLVFDGWSKGVLIGELLALYSGGPAAALPELPIQFGDFAVWQRDGEATRSSASAVEYWARRLAQAPEWDFPFQRPRPNPPAFEGRRRWIRLSPELSLQVRREGDRLNATMFMVLLAAWAAHCAQLTSRDDLVIGSLVAGRTIPDTEPLIGLFVNYLPLRIDCSGNPSFDALVQRVRGTCLDGYEHQAAPFQAVIKRLGAAMDAPRHPVFSTSFTLHNSPMPAIRLPGLQVEMIEFDDRLIRLDLELDLWWSGNRLEGFIVHNTALFDEEDILNLMEGYEAVLDRVTGHPGRA